jgi:hypothetical protein
MIVNKFFENNVLTVSTLNQFESNPSN